MAKIGSVIKKIEEDSKAHREATATQRQKRENRISKELTSDKVKAAANLKNDFSSEAWTRAAPSQTKIPDKRKGTISDAVKGTVKQYGAALGDSLATQYQATQGLRDSQNKELAADFELRLERAQADLDMMLSDNRAKPGTWSDKDIQVQRNVLKDAQQKAGIYAKVSDTQKKATTAARAATLDLSQAGAKDMEKAKQGHGAVYNTVVDAGSSFAQSMADATVGVATGTGMLPFVLRSFGGGTLEANAGGASFEDQLKYGTATAAKEYITEKLFGLAVPQSVLGKAGRGSFDDAIKGSIRNVTNKLAKTETGRRALGGFLTWLASGATEGLEEGIGAAADNLIITPTLKTWEQDKRTTMEKFEDGLYDMLIGTVSGLMGVTNLVTYDVNGPGGTGGPSTPGPSVQQISPAADAQTRAQQAASEAVKQGTPEATVLSAAETAFTGMGMNVKTAKKKAAVVQRLVNGEKVSQKDINTLNPTSKETQAAFTRLTGVEFPDKMTVEQMYTLYRSAAQKAQGATVTEADLADQAAVEAAQAEAVAQEQTAPTDISEVTLEQMRDAGSEVSPETQARIDAAAADLSSRVSNLDIGPDGNALATYGQFAEAYRSQVNGQATDAEVKQQYQNFRNDSRTVLFGGHRLTYGQFSGFIREVVAQGQDISDADMESLFNQAILDTLSDEDALDRYEGKTQAASKRTGTSRTLKLDNGLEMTQAQFEAFFRDLYGKQGRNLSEDELDAFYNQVLLLADRGKPLPYDEAMAQFMKEESDNGRDGEEKIAGESGEVRADSGERKGRSGSRVQANRETDSVRDEGKTGTRQSGPSGERTGEPGVSERPVRVDGGKSGAVQEGNNGVTVALDIKPIYVVDESAYTDEIRDSVARAKRMGWTFYPVRGRIESMRGTKAEGLVLRDEKIKIVQTDSTTEFSKIDKHEDFHLLTTEYPDVVGHVIQKTLSRMPRMTMEYFDTFIKERYGPSYEGDYGAFSETNYVPFYEEFFADMLGGMNSRARFKPELLDAFHSVITYEVNEYVRENNIPWYKETTPAKTASNKKQSSTSPKRSRAFSVTTEKTWAEQLEERNDTEPRSALYIEETPNLLAEVGLKDLPMCMTKSHANDAMAPKDPNNAHKHGLSEAIMAELPELLSKPVMIFNSQTQPGNIVVLLDAVDADGNPVIATIRPNGHATVDGKYGPANFITSVYGRSNFAPVKGKASLNNQMSLVLRNKDILYWNEKRTKALFQRSGLQLPYTLERVPSDTILGQHDGYVKGNKPKRAFSVSENREIPGAFTEDQVESIDGDTFTDPETGGEVFYNEESSSYGGKFYRDEIGDFLEITDEDEAERPDFADLEEATEVDYAAEMEALYAQERASAKAPGRSNDSAAANLEMTPTDTPAFQKWFRDGTEDGLLTNEDGSPKALLHGTPRAGFTRFDIGKARKGHGIFLSDSMVAASNYADRKNQPGAFGEDVSEFKPITVDSWKQAVQFADADLGMRLEHGPKGYDLMRFAEDGSWVTVGHFADSVPGLKKFNEQYGKLHSEAMVANPGYYQMYASMADPLVYDAKGRDWKHVMFSAVKGRFLSTDEIVDYAFEAGYDGVIFQNVRDGADSVVFDDYDNTTFDSVPMTEYIVKSPGQVKSIYNSGTWNRRVSDLRFSMESEQRSKLEDFLRQLEDEYGDGSPDAMFATFQQLERAQQRAEQRAADAEAAQQAAEWTAKAEAEAARKAQKAKDDRRMKRQKQHYQDKAKQAAVDARQAKANAVREARLAEQMNAGAKWAERLRQHEEKATAKMEQMRTSAQQRMDALRIRHQDELTAIKAERDLREAKLRADRDQKIEDVKLAERMNAGRRVANAKRRGEDAVAAERERRIRDHKLASQDAKEAAKVLRKYQKGDTEEVSNNPTDTKRDAYQRPAFRDVIKKKADKLRSLGREAQKVFFNATVAVDDFSKLLDTDATTSVLLRNATNARVTAQIIQGDHLVSKNGDILDDRSLEDVAICWTGKGKSRKYDDASQIVLQDYMLHRHNVDRMSFRDKAQQELESFEASHSWLTSLTPTEFAELVADDNRTAQRYQELIEQFQSAKNKPIFKDDNGVSLSADYSRSMVEQYEQQYDWVKDKAEGIYEWWDKFMREWVVGDSLSTEEYENLRRIYPSYVPTYRVDKGGFTAGVNTFGGTASTRKATRKATGGGSPVANIEDSFLRLMQQNVMNQRSNAVLRSITDAAMLDDAGELNGFAIFEWDSAPEMFRWSQAATGLEGALEGGTDQAAVKALQKDNDVCRVRAWVDGEQVSAVVSKELYDALDFSFNHKDGWFTKLGQKLTSPMKMAITGINPLFAIRNFVRDNSTAQINSMAVANSISGIKFEKYLAQAIKEMATNSSHWQNFQALGGTNANQYNNEAGALTEAIRNRKLARWNIPGKIAQGLGFFGEKSESATRFAEYLATIDRLPGGDTYTNRLIGIKNAAEVTVDFSRKGTFGSALNAWVPYWNPAAQGISKVFREFFDQPTVAKKLLTLGRASMTVVLPEIVFFALRKAIGRDDDWDELDDRTKDTYYCIPLPGQREFLKVPKNRDWGQLLGTPFMRILEGLDGRADPFENYYEVSFSPNFVEWMNLLDSAFVVSQALDLAKNEDFAGRTIVPYSLQQGSKAEQWDGDTSKYAKLIADLGNELAGSDLLSPMQIDYLINDYFGDFGDMFQRFFPVAPESSDTETQMSAGEQVKKAMGDTYESVRKSFVANNLYSNKIVSDYYDMMDSVSRKAQDAKNHGDEESYKDDPAYKLDQAFNAEDSPVSKISELNRKARELSNGPEKDTIKEQIATLAGQALDMYDAVMSGEVVEPKMEMQYGKYGSTVSKALIDLKDYAEDYAFQPSSYVPKSYTDPGNKKREYVLDDAAKAKYSEMYTEEYGSVMDEVIRSGKYRSANDKKKAELLEAARDDVTEQTKKNFMKWLKQNYKPTMKSK